MNRFFLILSMLLLGCPFLNYGQDSSLIELIKQGIAFHDEGEYERAIEFYQKALKIDPASSLANYELSLTYLSLEDYKKAEKYSKKVIKSNDEYVLHGYMNYGTALDMQGKAQKAIKAYEKGMQDNDHYLLSYNHALTCYNQGEMSKAKQSAIKAINNNPSHASSHLILSKIMEKSGERIKAMLPLYYFLLLEPNTDRAKVEYGTLNRLLNFGVQQTSEQNINISIPIREQSEFSAAEMMISLTAATNIQEKKEGKTPLELFSANNDQIFKILGELKKEQQDFMWSFYVPFFHDLAKEDLTEIYSYYISLSIGEEIFQWIDEHPDDFKKFEEWFSK
ncbi:tetratricopeptide repeat protein [Persicobacter diffluens]